MDYYERKRRSQMLVKKLLSEGYKNEDIGRAVEDSFQLSPKWTEKYIERLEGSTE